RSFSISRRLCSMISSSLSIALVLRHFENHEVVASGGNGPRSKAAPDDVGNRFLGFDAGDTDFADDFVAVANPVFLTHFELDCGCGGNFAEVPIGIEGSDSCDGLKIGDGSLFGGQTCG